MGKELRLFEETKPDAAPAVEPPAIHRRLRRYGLKHDEQCSQNEWKNFIPCAKAYFCQDAVYTQHARERMLAPGN